jgi:hypothetical protein
MEVTVNNTGGGVIVTVVVFFREMQQRVKEESSQLAFRRQDRDGNPLFESLVMDEGYESRFRLLFYAARGELSRYVSAYTKCMRTVGGIIETGKERGEDYVLQLVMPADFNVSTAEGVGVNVGEFMESYILYRWLDGKLQDEADGYMARADKLKKDINADLNRRAGAIERPGGFW